MLEDWLAHDGIPCNEDTHSHVDVRNLRELILQVCRGCRQPYHQGLWEAFLDKPDQLSKLLLIAHTNAF